jgi:hypothetical protein
MKHNIIMPKENWTISNLTTPHPKSSKQPKTSMTTILP